MNRQEALDRINRLFPQTPGQYNPDRAKALEDFSSQYGDDNDDGIEPDSRYLAEEGDIIFIPVGEQPGTEETAEPDADSDRADALQTLAQTALSVAGDDAAYQSVLDGSSPAQFGDSIVNNTTVPPKLMEKALAQD